MFTSLFALEMTLKLFAKGVIWHPGAYFRNGWDMWVPGLSNDRLLYALLILRAPSLQSP